MQSNDAKIIVVSSIASLDQIEGVLGESGVEGHSRESARANGLVRKQTIWLRTFSCGDSLLEDVTDDLIEWLTARVEALRRIDPDIFLKICCTVSASSERQAFAVNPRMAHKLSTFEILLLLEFDETRARSMGSPLRRRSQPAR